MCSKQLGEVTQTSVTAEARTLRQSYCNTLTKVTHIGTRSYHESVVESSWNLPLDVVITSNFGKAWSYSTNNVTGYPALLALVLQLNSLVNCPWVVGITLSVIREANAVASVAQVHCPLVVASHVEDTLHVALAYRQWFAAEVGIVTVVNTQHIAILVLDVAHGR